jgi:flagellar biosynthetic protein FliR
MATLALYFGLVLARVATFVTVFPLLGGPNLPALVKAGLALALTMVWMQPALEALPASALLATAEPSCVGLVVALGREALLGALFGYGLGLFLVPVQVAGEYLTQEMGLAFAQQVNPAAGGSASPLTQILEQLAIVLFFGLDGHHILFGVLHATFAHYPVLTSALPAALPAVTADAAHAEEWGLLLAAPVGLCLLLTTVTLALLSRVAPQLNLFAVGFPVRLGVGLLTSLLLLPSWVGALVRSFSRVGELVAQWM